MRTLDEIIAFQNEDVLSRFTDLFAVSEQEAAEIFTETKKFLFLSTLPNIFIPDELLILDEMWHNFILFTKVYQDFCFSYFGVYMHHIPASKKEKEWQKQNFLANPEGTKRDFENKLTKLISTAYDRLGTDTVIKWFRVYPEKYSMENIKALRKC